MLKVKNACMKVGSAIKSGWQETNKVRVVRLLAFCIGFIFNILGIIGVAVWKYIFAMMTRNISIALGCLFLVC